MPRSRPLRIVLPVLLGLACNLGGQAGLAAEKLDKVFVEASASPAALRLLIQKMPKGGDLHHHMGGGIYAEDFLKWSAQKGGCLNIDPIKLIAPPCQEPGSVPVAGLEVRDPGLYNKAITGLSTRGFRQGVGDPEVSGHDLFFDAFGRFSWGSQGKDGEVLAVAMEQAALSHNNYLELMAGGSVGRALRSMTLDLPWDEATLDQRLALIRPRIAELLPLATTEINTREAGAAQANLCATKVPRPGCGVTVRYISAVGREASPEAIFNQMAFAFALVQADPRYVGVNILAPEDGPIALRDYSLHMRLMAFFRSHYPKVPLSLHAGELAPGLVPPRDLASHIAEAVTVAGARRIGHGVDIASEAEAMTTLGRMARDRIAVEVNLSSNDIILGIKGRDHPLRLYMAAGVPVVLSTDDAGVARSSLTEEYMQAVTDQGLSYGELKQMARNSLIYAFLEGDSLMSADGTRMTAPCDRPDREPSQACSDLLARSAKAREQWRLERDFEAYETEALGFWNSLPQKAALRR